LVETKKLNKIKEYVDSNKQKQIELFGTKCFFCGLKKGEGRRLKDGLMLVCPRCTLSCPLESSQLKEN
jgi:hypothetical protein